MANYYSHPHICQCLSRLLTLRPHFPVTIAGDRQKTGREFVEEVLALAQGLLHIGVTPGDVVAISAYNSDWYLDWLLAIAFVGGIAAPLNYRWSFEEARLAMTAVRPVMLVIDESCYTWYLKLQEIDIPSLRWHVLLDSPSSDFPKKLNVLTPEMLMSHPMKLLPFDYSWAPEGAVIVCFTSGTTGKPKGVTLSHGALIIQSLAKIAIVGYSEDDVYLHTAPLCHIGGLSSAMAMLMVGGCHVLMPKFNAESAVEAIEQYAVTSLITVPAIMASLISIIRQKETWKGGETVKKILNGGGSLSHELIKDTSIFLHNSKLISAYGMTEACSSMTFLTLYDPTHETVTQPLQIVGEVASSSFIHQPQGICVGKAAPHVELKICVDGTGHIGRILTRGPHVMLGYWDQIQTKILSPRNEAWFDTGDIGSIDNHGNLWLLGRTNGRIKSGGENIYPEEVEAILQGHTGIASVVVVGIPDPRLTEMVAACIQLRENWQWSEQSNSNHEFHLSRKNLQQYCTENNLSRFKIPKVFIIWRKAFPLTTTGKVRRDQVRKEAMSKLQSLHSSLFVTLLPLSPNLCSYFFCCQHFFILPSSSFFVLNPKISTSTIQHALIIRNALFQHSQLLDSQSPFPLLVSLGKFQRCIGRYGIHTSGSCVISSSSAILGSASVILGVKIGTFVILGPDPFIYFQFVDNNAESCAADEIVYCYWV